MSLTLQRTISAVDQEVLFLQDDLTSFDDETVGYATGQQLVGDGYLDFAFDQSDAIEVVAAAGIAFATYPTHGNSMAEFNLLCAGFCVRGNESTDKVWIKFKQSFIDTTVRYSASLKMRVERIGTTFNFYTSGGTIGGIEEPPFFTLRHTETFDTTGFPADCLFLVGRNGCKITEAEWFGAVQPKPVLDLTKNVYIPITNYKAIVTNPWLFCQTLSGETYTWHFPNGQSFTNQSPTTILNLPYIMTVRLEVPDGVDRIEELRFCTPVGSTPPDNTRRVSPPDLSNLANLRILKVLGYEVFGKGPDGTDNSHCVGLTSSFLLPGSLQVFEFDLLEPPGTQKQYFGVNTPGRNLDFTNLINLSSVKVNFRGNSANNAFSLTSNGLIDFGGCTNLTDITIFSEERDSSNRKGSESTWDKSYFAGCGNIENLLLSFTTGVGIQEINKTYLDSFLVAIASAITRSTPIATITIQFRGSNSSFDNPEITGNIATLTSAATAGANSIVIDNNTGYSVGDRVLIDDGAASEVNNTLIIASITGSSPYTVTFESGQTLNNGYSIGDRVFNMEDALGATQHLRLLGHTVTVIPDPI